MVTYEDITEMFLSAAEATGLSVHPEFWLNSQTLEREFACTLLIPVGLTRPHAVILRL